MNVAFNVCVALAMLAVFGILVVGIVSMTRGGEFNKKYGNRLMQARVILQGAVLAFLALSYYFSKT